MYLCIQLYIYLHIQLSMPNSIFNNFIFKNILDKYVDNKIDRYGYIYVYKSTYVGQNFLINSHVLITYILRRKVTLQFVIDVNNIYCRYIQICFLFFRFLWFV